MGGGGGGGGGGGLVVYRGPHRTLAVFAKCVTFGK